MNDEHFFLRAVARPAAIGSRYDPGTSTEE